MKAERTDILQALAVRARLSSAEARVKLDLRSPWPPFGKIVFEKVELVYLPHWLFTMRVRWKDAEEDVSAAVDAVLGHFARWEDDGHDKAPLDDPLPVSFRLTREEARKRLLDQYRWVLIGTGLKLRKSFKVLGVEDGPPLYYPFFAGIHRSRAGYRVEVIDAVTGERQGGKVRDAVISAWMIEQDRPS